MRSGEASQHHRRYQQQGDLESYGEDPAGRSGTRGNNPTWTGSGNAADVYAEFPICFLRWPISA
jgi:hypothetical protein